VSEAPAAAAVRRIDPSFVALVAVVVVTLPLLLHWGRDQWFFLDEWEFLVNRELRDVGSLFRPHNGHWVTIPAIAYRLVFQVWGITTYTPYQVLAVLGHGAVAVAVWAVMRRLGVRGWIATATLVPYVLFGSGRGNILFSFQIALTWSVALGLASLLLVTHDGPFGRRDVAGLVAGIGALMCSAVGVPLVAATGLAVLVRRGWRSALAYGAPLAAGYLLWYVLAGGGEDTDAELGPDVLRFVAEMVRATFAGLGQVPLVGVLLAVVAVAGLAVGTGAALERRDRDWLAVAAALVAGLAAFGLVTGYARVALGGVASAGADRYVDVAAALLLPFVALGAEVAAVHRRALAAVPLGLLAIAMPGHLDELATPNLFTLGDENAVAALAASDLLASAPSDQRFAPSYAPTLGPTVLWLRSVVRQDRAPSTDGVTPEVQLAADGMLALHQVEADAGGPDPCPVVPTVEAELRGGDAVDFVGIVEVRVLAEGTESGGLRFDSQAGGGRLDVTGPVAVRITGVGEGGPRSC
jgi:hypothetical protein